MPSAPETTETPSTETRVAEPKPNDKKSAGKPAPSDARFLAAVEAVIFSADRPVSPTKLAEGLSELEGLAGGNGEGAKGQSGKGGSEAGPHSATSPLCHSATGPDEGPIDAASIADAVKALNAQYEGSARSFRIEQVAGGYRVMTLAEYAGIVGAFQKQRDAGKLSKPALETLAIIAYRQPITRADLEAIRGVSCGEVLRSLLEKRLIAITGRAEVLGRPMLYGTTRAFLDAFGLSSIKDLPQTGDHAGEFSQNL